MGRLTKKESKLHQQALDIVFGSDKKLNFDEKEFIFKNYAGDGIISTGAFFTPFDLAFDFTLDASIPQGGSCIEFCSGIGVLAYAMSCRYQPKRLVCVELNQEYCNVGERLVPWAEWVCMDAFQYPIGERFDIVIGNPPFGKVKTSTEEFQGRYRGEEFEYKIIEHGARFSEFGAFILPQSSSGFIYSGSRRGYRVAESAKFKAFSRQTGLELMPGCGIDTGIFRDQWHGASPLCEVITVEY
ncbi:methyltransferase [Edwardsiella tarda]|uniref:methyltransferase n=1 Tax=Edwardsiella tarda TaxID=636 RepID=UPI00351C3F8D